MRILEQGDDYPGGLGSVLPDNSLLSPSPDAGAEKPGVCPQLQESTECVEECSSDNQCFDSLKCCQAGCSFICSLPNGNPSAIWQRQGGAVKCCERQGAHGSGRKGTRDPGTLTPWKVEAVETRSSCALPCPAWGGCGRERGRGTRASLRCGPGGRSPHSWLGSILWCMTGFRARTARLCSGTRAQWLPWLETVGNPWVASGLGPEPWGPLASGVPPSGPSTV